ncbi:MAG: diacylglycerol kinase family protein [Phycisphaerae bacterium]|nr:diacylglycerol kinase family protein [Phycisphaerae bacterium]
MRRVAILFNPVSGSGRAARIADAVGRALIDAGHDVRSVATRRDPVATWMPAALADRDVAVVVGGDGAVRLTAGAAAAANVAIYHCPAGTENLLARHLELRARPECIVRALAEGRIRRFDLGMFCDEPFVLMASFGFDADVVHALASRRSGAISHLSYAPVIARALVSWRAPSLAISLDGEPLVEIGQGVLVVANVPSYAFRLDPGRGAIPDDGLLDVTFLPCRSGLGAIRWAIEHFLRGGRVPGVARFRAERLSVVIDRPAHCQLDGDPFVPADAASSSGITAASIRVLRQVLPLVLPATTSPDGIRRSD